MPKQRLLLPDTMVVVAAMRHGRWTAMCQAYDVIVPSIIASETKFYDDANQKRIYVDCVSSQTAGKHSFRENSGNAGPTVSSTGVSACQGDFTLWEAPVSEFAKTDSLLHPDLAVKVHDGEREAVTYLRLVDDETDVWFVTADSGGIQAAVAFGMGHCAVSLDQVLKKCGQQVAALSDEFRDPHVKMCRDIGGRLL